MKMTLKLSILPLIFFTPFLLHANAGAALIGPSIFFGGIISTLIFSTWMLFGLFIFCVIIDCLILNNHIIKHKKWMIIASICSNALTVSIGGFALFWLTLLMAFSCKYNSLIVQLIVTIVLLMIITLIDVIIQMGVFHLLFSVKHEKKLFFKIFIFGFVILASIVFGRILLHI